MFLPLHLYTGSGSDQKVLAPTGSGSATLIAILLVFRAFVLRTDRSLFNSYGMIYSMLKGGKVTETPTGCSNPKQKVFSHGIMMGGRIYRYLI